MEPHTKKCLRCQLDITKASKRCPHCGSRQRNFDASLYAAIAVAFLFVIVLPLALINSFSTALRLSHSYGEVKEAKGVVTNGSTKGASTKQDQPSDTQQRESAAKKAVALEAERAKVRQATINEIAPIYCKNHKQIQMQRVDWMVKNGWPMFDSYDDIAKGRGIRGWTAEQCNTIIAKFVDQGTQRDELMGIAESKIWVGMSRLALMYSWGFPDDINSTTTAASVHQQWVYGDDYVYVDNDEVTSYQQ